MSIDNPWHYSDPYDEPDWTEQAEMYLKANPLEGIAVDDEKWVYHIITGLLEIIDES